MDAKKAVEIALSYFHEMYGNTFSGVRLEEIEKSGSNWIVTLGYDESIGIITVTKRGYKVFTIDRTSGEVISMKIRTVE